MNDLSVSRRQFAGQALGSVVTYSLLQTLFEGDAFADEIKPTAAKWLADVQGIGLDLRSQTITQADWRTKVEELFGEIDLPELLTFIDFEKLVKNVEMVDNGARSLRFEFPKVAGISEKLSFSKQIFALKKGRSVVPHGHNNMATAFLILKGKLHGRHYERLEDEPKHMIIKPTIDRSFQPGEHSSITDFKDNVHWFKALAEPSYIFNIHLLGVRPGSKLRTGRVYVDPNGEKLDGGRVRAKRLDYKEAHKLYG